MTIVAIGRGVYKVTDGDRTWTVAVAGPPENRWVWVDGQVTQIEADAATPTAPAARRRSRGRGGSHDLAAPMPATVVKVLVEAGAQVARGDTLLMLEAMKMELPIRAPRDGVVRALRCTAGELVQPGVPLLDLE